MTKTQTDEYDSPWKITIEVFFEWFVTLFMPHIYGDIDWERGYEFLDQELQKIVRDADLGKRLADKLVKVYLKDGDVAYVIIHIEVQSQSESDFAARMFVYYYRIRDRYEAKVMSVAVLGDEDDTWRPDRYTDEQWGCRVDFQFPIVKLSDFAKKWDDLVTSTNPFALVVMAHLKTKETRKDLVARKQWKYYLVRLLYEKGYSKDDVMHLFALLDWMMQLPEGLDKQFWQDVEVLEEEYHMEYVMGIERRGIKKGYQQGFEQGIKEGKEQGLQEGKEQGIQEGKEQGLQLGLHIAIDLGIKLRFGDTGNDILDEIRRIDDIAVLQAIQGALMSATTLDEIRRIYA